MSGTMVRTCVAAAGLTFASGIAWAQCEPLDPFPCPDTTLCDPTSYPASYLEGEEVWYPPSPADTFRNDRRPPASIYLWNHGGSYDHNPLGLHPNWWSRDDVGHSGTDCPVDEDENGRPDQFDWLIAQLDDAYGRGFRRIILYLPYGQVFPFQAAIPSGQWWAMAPWRRYWFECTAGTPTDPGGVAWWINEHRDLYDAANDIEVSVYIGFQENDACTPCHEPNNQTELERIDGKYRFPCAGATLSKFPEPDSAAHAEVLRQNLQPWIDVGMKMIWLDASGGAGREQFRQYAWSPDYRLSDVKLGGEAFAVDPDSPPTGRWHLAADFFDAAPFLMILESAEITAFNGRVSLMDTTAHQWTTDPGWEALIWPILDPRIDPQNGNNNPRPDWTPALRYQSMYNFYVAKGFSIVSDPPYSEYAERLLGIGAIDNRSDFNGDGVANSQDFFDFLDRWNTSLNYIGRHPTDAKPLTFFHGDINNDGAVNSQDYFDWIGDFYDPIQPQPFTLGVMHWDPNTEWVPTEDEWLYY